MLQNYIKVRPVAKSQNEQFFVFSDNSLVLPSPIYKNFQMVVNQTGLDHTNYSFHSLRAGRTQDLLHLGLSVQTIKEIGRWKSNAVFTYLEN